MQRALLFLSMCALLCGLVRSAPAATDIHLDIQSETQPLNGRDVTFTIQLHDDVAAPVAGQSVTLRPDGEWQLGDGASLRLVTDEEGKAQVGPLRLGDSSGRFEVELEDGSSATGKIRSVSALWTLLPPFLAIILALWTRQVLLALTAGVFGGAWIIYGGPVGGFVNGLIDFVVASLSDSFQAAILIFTATLGGMVGIMAKSGGTQGVVNSAQRWIKGPLSAQLMTALLGLLIFFDDYANTLLVGNTMRPVTDRMKVSREKLSYLVDCTAAPVVTIALMSTWVGYQVGLIGDGMGAIGRSASEGYAIFVQGVPYSGYSWFALALVFWVILSRRDLGPMVRAEYRARSTGKVLADGAKPLVDDIGKDLQPPEGKPHQARQALIPISIVVIVTALGLWFDGKRSVLEDVGSSAMADKGIQDFLSAADPANALLWAVMLGTIVAVLLSVSNRVLSLGAVLEAWTSGAKAMLPALIILVLAWSIGDVCERLGTANVVVDWATGNLSARMVPTISFLIAAFLGFSTGTSWGTMAILMPIVIPLAHELPLEAALSEGASTAIFLSSIASVLSGSVLGDHCSPISDTTIMSSMASGADHVDHVRTQLPYALTAGGMAVVLGTIPAGFGVSPWITLPTGFLMLGVVMRVFGRNADTL